MANAKTIFFETRQGVMLRGLWLGGVAAKKVIVFVHGLGGSLFSGYNYLSEIASEDTAVVLFENRGHDWVTRIKVRDSGAKGGVGYISGGGAMEVFTDCVDDLMGVADFVRGQGAVEVYLVGHSTGCQKIVYALVNSDLQDRVSGVVLMAPMSDYAGSLAVMDREVLERAVMVGKEMVAGGRGMELLPAELGVGIYSAQRFVSLNDIESAEEVFPYAFLKKEPIELKKISLNMRVILAEMDEHRDREMREIKSWFDEVVQSKDYRCVIVEGANHGFEGMEKSVQKIIEEFVGSPQQDF
ncbi:MAG: hypothetical protein KatS3mg087_0867 [Patescibacteria group bacterium]|nr:MAG: hypothetical protein KatS3mg087_0867 [Patescibacteria group bacterium]